jgi:predicted nucleotidyltransferase
MNKLVADHHSELIALCKKYEVRQLELFGSAARGEFDPSTSDLDFLVVYRRGGSVAAADHYLGLLAALEDLFARKIDLVEIIAARNPYFIAQALKHRVLLYAA